MSEKNLAQWLSYLEQLHPQSIDLGLQRVAEVGKRLALLTPTAKVITVAGTNGKGSFVASLAAILRSHDKNIGAYTSPHLLRFNERIMLNQQEVDDGQIVHAFEQIEQARAEISLSYFEYTTLAALFIFAQQDLDYILLEVGLGGRLDAVNIVDADIAVITSIALDHQYYLGDTREKIAFEKAGILREHTPLISAEADLLTLLPALETNRACALLGRDFLVTQKDNTWQFQDKNYSLDALKDKGVSVPSAAAAIVCAEQLLAQTLDINKVVHALNDVTLAGRFQRIEREDGITVFLDVAHNPHAAQLLHRHLAQAPLAQGAKRIAVFHCLHDKDIAGVVAAVNDDMMGWMLGGLDHPRASDVLQLDSIIRAQGCNMISHSKNMRQAFSRALSLCRPGDQIVAFGSFFVVADLLPRVHR